MVATIGENKGLREDEAIADDHWVAIDASVSGELRFALVTPGDPPRLERIRTYATDSLPTFTDGLMRFAADTGTPLRALDATIAVAGAVSGTSIPVARSRWTISRSGLAVLFRRPPLILNDVAARAWAVLATPTGDRLRGAGVPEFNRPGRRIMIVVDEGVGCAIIDVDQAAVTRIVESEAGHGDFAPADAAQDQIAAKLRGGAVGAIPSWEQVLTLEAGERQATVAGDRERHHLMGGLLGRFVVNMILAAGAWEGVMLTGRRVQRMLAGEGRPAFDAAFTQRRHFRRLVEATPCWHVHQAEPVLTGAAMMMNQHYRLHGTVDAPVR